MPKITDASSADQAEVDKGKGELDQCVDQYRQDDAYDEYTKCFDDVMGFVKDIYKKVCLREIGRKNEWIALKALEAWLDSYKRSGVFDMSAVAAALAQPSVHHLDIMYPPTDLTYKDLLSGTRRALHAATTGRAARQLQEEMTTTLPPVSDP